MEGSYFLESELQPSKLDPSVMCSPEGAAQACESLCSCRCRGHLRVEDASCSSYSWRSAFVPVQSCLNVLEVANAPSKEPKALSSEAANLLTMPFAGEGSGHG